MIITFLILWNTALTIGLLELYLQGPEKRKPRK